MGWKSYLALLKILSTYRLKSSWPLPPLQVLLLSPHRHFYSFTATPLPLPWSPSLLLPHHQLSRFEPPTLRSSCTNWNHQGQITHLFTTTTRCSHNQYQPLSPWSLIHHHRHHPSTTTTLATCTLLHYRHLSPPPAWLQPPLSLQHLLTLQLNHIFTTITIYIHHSQPSSLALALPSPSLDSDCNELIKCINNPKGLNSSVLGKSRRWWKISRLGWELGIDHLNGAVAKKK